MTPDKYRVTQTRYLGDELMAAAGEIVYLYGKSDFGAARAATDKTGSLHVSVSKDMHGNRVPFVIPLAHLHKIEGKPQWP
jgi:hypothetical protein